MTGPPPPAVRQHVVVHEKLVMRHCHDDQRQRLDEASRV